MTTASRWVLGLVLVCGGAVSAQDARCHTCGGVFPLNEAVFWGTKTFCSKECKDVFWREYQDKQFRCRICNKKVYDPSKPQPGGRTPDLVDWDGLCQECREAKQKAAQKDGGRINASSNIETFGPKEPVRRERRPLPRPPPIEDESGGVPTITWALFGLLGLLVGIRIYAAGR